MEEYQERPTLPTDSILHLKVEEIRDREHNGPRGAFKKLEFKFKILDIQAVGGGSPKENYEAWIGESIYGSVPFRFNDSAQNPLKQWTEAILGMELSVGFELDTELLEGRKVRGVTRTYDKRNVDPKTGQPFKGHQVDSLLPFGGSVLGGPAASAPQPVAAAAQSGFGFGEEPPF